MIMRMSSVCVDGTWTDSAIYPPGEIQEPMHLFQPDQPMPACRCKPLKLEYNPNNEEGNTDFHCETPLIWEVCSQFFLSFSRGYTKKSIRQPFQYPL